MTNNTNNNNTVPSRTQTYENQRLKEEEKVGLDTQRVQMMDSLMRLLGLSTAFQLCTEQMHII